MQSLEFEELAKHPIILGIRDFGRVLNIVEVVVVLDLLPQVGNSGSYSIKIGIYAHQFTPLTSRFY
jgi:hypothetical protein